MSADCTDNDALSVFEYSKDTLQFKLLGSVNDFNDDDRFRIVGTKSSR